MDTKDVLDVCLQVILFEPHWMGRVKAHGMAKLGDDVQQHVILLKNGHQKYHAGMIVWTTLS